MDVHVYDYSFNFTNRCDFGIAVVAGERELWIPHKHSPHPEPVGTTSCPTLRSRQNRTARIEHPK